MCKSFKFLTLVFSSLLSLAKNFVNSVHIKIIVGNMAKKAKPGSSKATSKGDRECPLCDQRYQDTRSLRRHIRDSHPGSTVSIPKSPRKECGFCHKLFADIRKHMKTCLLQKKDGGEEDSKKVKTNEDFVASLKRYWSRPGSALSEKTVQLYISKVPFKHFVSIFLTMS